MNKSESKYFNTAVRMDEALISLLARKDFAYITVREICETAGVNRSTFYLHYENTGDLLEEAVRYTEERFFGCFPAKQQSIRQKLHTCPPEQLILITPEYLTPYLTFIRDNRLIYRTALAKPGCGGVSNATMPCSGTYSTPFWHGSITPPGCGGRSWHSISAASRRSSPHG